MRRTYGNLVITTIIMLFMLVGCFGGSDDGGNTQVVAENPGYGILKGTLKGEDVAGALVIAEPLINGQTLTVSKVRNAVSKDVPSLIYTQADETGSFEFKDVPVGDYFIQAKQGQTTIGQAMKVSVRQEAPTALNIQVTATGSISGTVFMNGKTSHNGIMAYLLGTSYMAVSDSSGAYTISNVPVGSYTMEVWAGYGYEILQQSVSVSAGVNTSATSMTLNVPTISGAIYGKVIDQSGNAIVGATVEIKIGATTVGTTTTDSNGDYNVSGIAAGSYQIVSSKTGLSSVYIPTVIISPERKDINAPNLVMYVATAGAGTGNIEGYVLENISGSPIQGASVEIWINQQSLGNIYTDASGYYSFSNIAAGSYIIYSDKTGYRDDDVLATVFPGSTEVAMTLYLDTESVSFTPGNIAGQVKYFDNTPVPSATVELTQNNNIILSTTADATGNYSFSGVNPGIYTVKASDGTKQSYVIANVFNGTTITPEIIMLPKAQIGRITGFVRNQFFTPVGGASVEVYDTGNTLVNNVFTDASGYYFLDNVNEGVYRIDINTGGAITESRTVEVIVGVLLVPDVIIKSAPTSLLFDTYEIQTSSYRGAYMSQLNPQVQYNDGTTRNVYYGLEAKIKSGLGKLEGNNFFQPTLHGPSTLEISYFENGVFVTNEVGIISTWEIQVVDNVTCQGDELKIDSKGNVHIVYSDTGNSLIKYAMFDRKNWYFNTVDTGNIQSPSMVIDDFDQIHVAYYDASAAQLKYILSPTGDIWTGSSYVSSAGPDIGLFNDIVYDTREIPLIAAYNATDTSPQLFKWNGVSWDSQEIGYISSAGQNIKIAMSKVQTSLIYSKATSLDQAVPQPGWVDTYEIAAAGSSFTYFDVEYDQFDKAVVAYFNPNSNAIVMKRADVSPGMWNFVNMGMDLTPANTGNYLDLELGEEGAFYLAYQDNVNQDLYVSIDYTGSGNFIHTDVDSVGNVGSYISMDLYNDKIPVVSYFDSTNNLLKVAFY